MDTNHVLQKFAEKIDQHAEAHNRLAGIVSGHLTSEVQDALIKVLSSTYTHANARANIFITAGYAALFTIWANIKSLLSRAEMLSIAIFLTTSCILFILWEVYSMLMSTRAIDRIFKIMEGSPTQLAQRIKDFEKEQYTIHAALLKKQNIVVYVILAPGLAGASFIIFSSFRILFNF